ncbi:collectin-43-like [Sphaerodactylus townsendi]|uniref:collectin-43-like n=1 Tax=Sphaerodactylus townsendi TaxID=933632 RepID=UPI002026AE79|nr:collectin-43-like [Sphaerodactylus townsendi]
MTQPYIQTVLRLLILCLPVLGVSTQTAISPSTTRHVLKGWVPNACTLVVCAPSGRGPEEKNGDQELQGPVGAPSIQEPQRDDGARRKKRLRRDANQVELECLRKEIRNVQTQLNTYKAAINQTLKVLLMPHGGMVGNKIFKTDGSTGDYETAKTLCSQMGATIASPRNAAENKAVQQIVQWRNQKAILGINDIESEGTFVYYMTGEIIGYSNWASGEPNNLANEDCGEIHPDGKWHDRRCELEWLVICEWLVI